MQQKVRQTLTRIVSEVRSANDALPQLREGQGGVVGWLQSAHRAQVTLALTLLVGLWIMPTMRDSVVYGLLPTKTKRTGFLGLSSRKVSHPVAGPLATVVTITYWTAGLGASAVVLWLHIPVAISRRRNSQAEANAHGQTLPGQSPPPPPPPRAASSDAASGSDVPQVELATPSVLAGRYRIERQLGEGGMGQVFLADDETLARQVALKRLPAELLERDDMRQRFLREARALAQLNHPHVVQLFDFLEEQGGLWMVMEVVPGGDLEDLLEAGKVSVARTCRLGQQAASALGAAHERGIVHRDFKPANVMLTEDGVAKVMDFGIAKLNDAAPGQDTKLTQAGAIIGTPTYMSPEQAGGSEVGPPSDVYSLGATLYEMLCGEPVFSGNLTRVIAAHMTAVPPRLEDHGVHVPQPLSALVYRMLDKSPEGRPSIAEVVAVLGDLEASEAVAARGPKA